MKQQYKPITSFYKEFYGRFRLIANANACSPNNLEFCENKVNGSDLREVSLKKPIFLSRWPAKKDLPRQSVDILVSAQFRYRPGQTLLHNRSSVYVTYFRRENHQNSAVPVENLRFDYHPESEAEDDAHPLIHAHVFSSKRPQIDIPRSAKLEARWDKLKGRLNSFRLPVPNMTLPSVLCCLVACHLGAGEMKALLSKTKNERESFPGLAIETNQYKLFSDNSFAGSQWFERA